MKKILSLLLSVVLLITMLSVVPVTAQTTVQEESCPTPTEVIAGPDVFKGVADEGRPFPAYVSKEKAETVYNKYLVADFNLDFSAISVWATVSIHLDSATSDTKNGIAFQILGSSSFASNAKDFIDNPSGCGVVLRKQGTIINAAPLNTDKVGVIHTDYRIIIKRVIGATNTSVEFFMFEKGKPVPAAPMFSFTYTNEEYGPAVASLAFSTWNTSKFMVSDVKLFNYNIKTSNDEPLSIDDPTIVPTKTVESATLVGTTGVRTPHSPHITHSESTKTYNKVVIADFKFAASTFHSWGRAQIWVDSYHSNSWGGYFFEVVGSDAFYSAATNGKFLDNPSGVGVIFGKGSSQDGKETRLGVAQLNVTNAEFIKNEYRVIIKRVISDTETTLEFYMFDTDDTIPDSPLVSQTYTKSEYGSPSSTMGIITQESSNITLSDIKFYNYDLSIEPCRQSIDDPAIVPTKTVESATFEGLQSTYTTHEAYVTKDDVSAGTYSKILIADFKFSASSFASWAQAQMWLDSWNCDAWRGFRFDILGDDVFEYATGTATDKVGIVLRKCNSDGKAGTKILDTALLNATCAEFVKNEYRIILRRVMGAAETTFEFYMFDTDDQIPAEPMFTQTFANAEYNPEAIPTSTSICFTTKEPSNITLSDMKLYNYDLSIEPYEISIDDPTVVPTKTVDTPETVINTDGKSSVGGTYISQTEGETVYNKCLVSDFVMNFENHHVWASTNIWLDSSSLDNTNGYRFTIAGRSEFTDKTTAGETNTVGVILYKKGAVKDYAVFNMQEGQFTKKDWRVIIKRVIDSANTTVEFYMFPKEDEIPAEPMIAFTDTNANYGSPSTSVAFTGWLTQQYTVSNMKFYNSNLSIEPYAPFIGNRIEAPKAPEGYEAVESTIITRTSTTDERWLDTKAAPADYDYAFAVVGDTQYINRHAPEQFPAIYDWILDNIEDKKIKFVAGLGDITEGSNATDQNDWLVAQPQIDRLNGVVPFSIVRGNHDMKTYYKQYFPYEKYADNLGGSFDDTMINTYQELVIGRNKYLIMCLDYGADDDVLEWANEVAEAHPDHNVIVTTHGYLNPDGSLIVDGMATNEGYNDGDDMWHKFIKKHANITMVLCGHELSENIVAVQSKGENGNIVTQMMINPQVLDHLNSTDRPTGMVCMLYFSDGGRKVEVEYYSTVKQQYFKDVNQFNFEVDVVDNNIDGDMDGDGFIGAKDIADVKKCLLGTVNKAYYYDVTGEGDINILDLIRVKKYAAKVS